MVIEYFNPSSPLNPPKQYLETRAPDRRYNFFSNEINRHHLPNIRYRVFFFMRTNSKGNFIFIMRKKL